jgi:hypothetical protein
MRKRVSLLLAAVFFFSTLIVVAHHHADEADHHDCPECVVLHHAKTIDTTFVNIDLSPEFVATEYVILQLNFNIPVQQISPSEIRPPPA